MCKSFVPLTVGSFWKTKHGNLALKEIEGHESYYIIRASNKFEADSISGYLDGDFPDWIGCMFENFPEGFNYQFGEHGANMMNGSWWEYPMDKFEEMKEYLSNQIKVVK